ncbi:MAG TPA: type II toxin-antitoxin system VapC family toxin [Bryobacteraceae bacterium]|jgi:ribonuclease VapC
MVIDTSALVAIVREEPEAETLAAYLSHDDQPCLSAASLLEAHLVLSRSPQHVVLLSELLAQAEVQIIPVTLEIVTAARRACDKYGRGTQAALNFGDLFSYATAKTLGMPLLFKGGDFAYTDIQRVVLKQ